jgi:hypothetical protein
VGFPETSVRNYHHLLRNNPEERISYPKRGLSGLQFITVLVMGI